MAWPFRAARVAHEQSYRRRCPDASSSAKARLSRSRSTSIVELRRLHVLDASALRVHGVLVGRPEVEDRVTVRPARTCAMIDERPLARARSVGTGPVHDGSARLRVCSFIGSTRLRLERATATASPDDRSDGRGNFRPIRVPLSGGVRRTTCRSCSEAVRRVGQWFLPRRSNPASVRVRDLRRSRIGLDSSTSVCGVVDGDCLQLSYRALSDVVGGRARRASFRAGHIRLDRHDDAPGNEPSPHWSTVYAPISTVTSPASVAANE